MANIFNWELCSFRIYLTLTIVSIHFTTRLQYSFIRFSTGWWCDDAWMVYDVRMRGCQYHKNDEMKSKMNIKTCGISTIWFPRGRVNSQEKSVGAGAAVRCSCKYVVNGSSVELNWNGNIQVLVKIECKYLFFLKRIHQSPQCLTFISPLHCTVAAVADTAAR